MHLTWRELRVALRKEITQPETEKAFSRMRDRYPILKPHIDAGAAVRWLLDYRSHETQAEDEMLVLLRGLALDCRSELWQSLLFLGVWPSMEWVFRKLLPIAEDDHSIISGIWGSLIDVMEQDEFWRRPGIAKRLMYALWKRAKKDLLAAQKEREQSFRLAEAEYAALPKISGDPIIRKTQDAWPTPFKNPNKQSPEIPEEIEKLRQLLVDHTSLTPAESELLIRHFVRDETLSDIACQLGITHAACRKRCSRAVSKLREIPSRLRHLFVTHSDPDGMEVWKRNDDRNENEGDVRCHKPWMN